MISVIIPTYNKANLLPRAIKSVLNQTLQDFELIIIDDGSTDSTRKVVEEFQKQEAKIKYFWQKNSGSPAKPRNTGIKNAKGDYFAFLDDDDEWLPEKLEKQYRLFRTSKFEDIGFVGCNMLFIDGQITWRIKCNFKGKNFFQPLLGEVVPSNTLLIKRSVFNKVGLFDERFKMSDDWDMFIRISQKYGFDFVDEFLFKRYFYGENVSRTASLDLFIKDYIYLLEKHKNSYLKYPEAQAGILRTIGNSLILKGNIKEGREFLKKAIIIYPRPFNYFNLLVSYLGKKIYTNLVKSKRLINKIIHI